MRAQLLPRPGRREKIMRLENAVIETCPLPIVKVRVPEHRADVVLVIYGCGSPERTARLKAHRAAGGHVICLDRGYFGRTVRAPQEHYRIALDQLHVSPEHLDLTPTNDARFARFGIDLRNDYAERGHVVVAGLGIKSRAGLNLHTWEANTLARAQKRFPDRRVMYRPKLHGVKGLDTVRWPWTDGINSIEHVLRGASLAIVRHSNVAVDACIAGIPVECEDGAARWLYQSNPQQTTFRRLSFLQRLAWWNWRVDEMGDMWRFILPRLT